MVGGRPMLAVAADTYIMSSGRERRSALARPSSFRSRGVSASLRDSCGANTVTAPSESFTTLSAERCGRYIRHRESVLGSSSSCPA